MRSGLLGAAVLLLLAGCGRTELFAPPLEHLPDASWARDASTPFDAGQFDAGPDKPDASTPDGGCAQPRHWRLAKRTISGVSLVDGPPPEAGATERLRVQVRLETTCEVLAGVAVTLNPGGATDFIQLAAQAWVSEPPCAPVNSTANRVVSIPGRGQDNLRVVVADLNSPGGGLRLTYQRNLCGARLECLCRSDTPPGNLPEGAACVTDCGCANGVPCLGYFGFAGAAWSCTRSCNTNNDCESDERCRPSVGDGVAWSCGQEANVCQLDADCPAGFTCVLGPQGRRCRDGRLYPAAMGCRCDGDCPAGQHCSKIYEKPTCELRCRSSNDCPEKGAGVFACGLDWTCMMLD
ncbi:MAG: hypothetical protein ACYC8T_09960 [Myxococcaceae bacterium]